jgi:hypothetical protein
MWRSLCVLMHRMCIVAILLGITWLIWLEDKMIYTAVGYAYDPQTRDWTKRVEVVCRNKMEAVRWCNFNRDWFKRLSIEEDCFSIDLNPR